MAIKILYVITKANWGGAQRYVYDLATAARDAGHEVKVIYGEPGVLSARLADEGIPAIRVKELERNLNIKNDWLVYRWLRDFFTHERPDVVHINSSKAGGLGALAARAAGVPLIVFTAHGWAFNESRPWWQKILIWKLAGLTVLLSHKTICVSEAIKKDIRSFPFVRNKLVVIRNGVACEALVPRSAARKMLAPHSSALYWIGMLSELHPTKRVDDAIRAFAPIAARYNDTGLYIISEGVERARLEQLITDLHLRKRVMLLGFVKDAPRYFSAFNMFIHASQSEALALAILEAGCASLPVVATHVGGIPEIITSGEHGLLVPVHNPATLTAAMESLMRDPQRAAELGTRLHMRVLAEFSKERMVAETLALYR